MNAVLFTVGRSKSETAKDLGLLAASVAALTMLNPIASSAFEAECDAAVVAYLTCSETFLPGGCIGPYTDACWLALTGGCPEPDLDFYCGS